MKNWLVTPYLNVMLDPTFENIDPTKLSKIIALDAEAPEWTPSDLGQILRHQLQAPLPADVRAPGQQAGATPSATFGGVLCDLAPPVEQLQIIKEYGRQCRDRPEMGLPAPVATTLYYAAIAVARLRREKRITSMDDAALCRGLEWTAQREWLDEGLRSVVNEALQKLAQACEAPLDDSLLS